MAALKVFFLVLIRLSKYFLLLKIHLFHLSIYFILLDSFVYHFFYYIHYSFILFIFYFWPFSTHDYNSLRLICAQIKIAFDVHTTTYTHACTHTHTHAHTHQTHTRHTHAHVHTYTHAHTAHTNAYSPSAQIKIAFVDLQQANKAHGPFAALFCVGTFFQNKSSVHPTKVSVNMKIQFPNSWFTTASGTEPRAAAVCIW
jgi:hypothetical protein